MGIPSYFSHLIKEHRQIVQTLQCVQCVDNLYLDSNSSSFLHAMWYGHVDGQQRESGRLRAMLRRGRAPEWVSQPHRQASGPRQGGSRGGVAGQDRRVDEREWRHPPLGATHRGGRCLEQEGEDSRHGRGGRGETIDQSANAGFPPPVFSSLPSPSDLG